MTELTGASLAALAAVVYTIAFAAVAYGGDLAPFLDWGIGLVLVGTAFAAVVGGATASTRGMVSHPEEAPLLLIVAATPSLLAATTAAGAAPGSDAQFATFLAFLMCSSFFTGILFVTAGRLHLSFVVRYLPYPVIGGVIVSIGYLLMISSVSLVTTRTVDIFSLPGALAGGELSPWVPWANGALGLFLVGRKLPATTVLPVGIIIGFVAFRIYLGAAGATIEEAEASGLLLGPFPEGGFLDGLHPRLLFEAKWGVVLSHMTILLVIAPVSALTCLIHIQAICRVTGEEPDLGRDLVSSGLANVAGAGTGNIISFPAISTSVLAARFDTRTLLVCGMTAGFSLWVAVSGAELLGMLPRGLLAMIILYLGLDMLITTLITEWRRLPARDVAPILAMLAATVFAGLFYGLALGVALSIFLFVVFSARAPFIRLETTLARRRSIVERGEMERVAIEEAGEQVRILQISGYLFFGTAHTLRKRIRELVEKEGPSLDVLVLDFQSVSDIDASAISSLDRIQQECRAGGIDVYITGIADFVATRLSRFGFGGSETKGAKLHLGAKLDDALQQIEESILASALEDVTVAPDSFLQELAAAIPDLDVEATFDTFSVPPDTTIIEEGEPTTDVFVLLEGQAAAVVGAKTPEPLIVARYEPGALIGEMAFYQGSDRSATVLVEDHARLARIEARKLAIGGGQPDALLAAFHRAAARHLSRRLDRTTRLLQDARI